MYKLKYWIHIENIDFERTILENMMSATPDIREPEARNTLGSFLFVGDDVHKPVKVLSGGERTRLALAVLVVSAFCWEIPA